MKKKLAGLFTALLAVLCVMPAGARAAEAEAPEPISLPPVRVSETSVDYNAREDNGELFAGYALQRFYGGGVSLLSVSDNAGSRLEREAEQALYLQLKEKVAEVAAQGGPATFEFTAEELGFSPKLTWTPEELAAAGIELPDIEQYTDPETGELSEEGQALFGEFLGKVVELEEYALDSDAVRKALQLDCPYELYWFDKTEGLLTGSACEGSLSDDDGDGELEFTVDGLSYYFAFSVAGEYQAPEYDPASPAVTNGVQDVSDAVANAAKIVELNAEKSDYEKLLAYKDAICKLTGYDHDSAEGSSVAYGNPWQLIYVFDEKPETNVVCEGYSKAFQYLCDLSSFEGDTHCYTVTGLMEGGTGEGPHMWNIVHIGGQNYLVDVTNSDEGSAGASGGLFLAGAHPYTGSDPEGYIVSLPGGEDIIYWYHNEDVATGWDSALWGPQVVTLSTENYAPGGSVPAPAARDAVTDISVQASGGGKQLKVSAETQSPLVRMVAASYDRTDLLSADSSSLPNWDRHTESFLIPSKATSAKVFLLSRNDWKPLCPATSRDV